MLGNGSDVTKAVLRRKAMAFRRAISGGLGLLGGSMRRNTAIQRMKFLVRLVRRKRFSAMCA
jgi:hypothetical protein